MMLILPYSKGTLRHNKTKTVNQFQYLGTEKRPGKITAAEIINKILVGYCIATWPGSA